MKILGHKSAGMSMTYARTSPTPSSWPTTSPSCSPAQSSPGRWPTPCAPGSSAQDALDWLKTNFYKTELELGHCLRLPQEGPCECDLYLTCAKFVTTPQYAPRLRERLCLRAPARRRRRRTRLGPRGGTSPADRRAAPGACSTNWMSRTARTSDVDVPARTAASRQGAAHEIRHTAPVRRRPLSEDLSAAARRAVKARRLASR